MITVSAVIDGNPRAEVAWHCAVAAASDFQRTEGYLAQQCQNLKLTGATLGWLFDGFCQSRGENLVAVLVAYEFGLIHSPAVAMMAAGRSGHTPEWVLLLAEAALMAPVANMEV